MEGREDSCTTKLHAVGGKRIHRRFRQHRGAARERSMDEMTRVFPPCCLFATHRSCSWEPAAAAAGLNGRKELGGVVGGVCSIFFSFPNSCLAHFLFLRALPPPPPFLLLFPFALDGRCLGRSFQKLRKVSVL